MHWFAAVIATGFYLYHVPLTFALVWRETGTGGGFALFEGRRAVKRARENVGKGKKRKRRVAWKTLRALLPHLILEELTMQLELGASDAAETALLCGALRAAGFALRQRARRGRIAVSPSFSGSRLKGELRGVVRIEAGEAAAALIREKLGMERTESVE